MKEIQIFKNDEFEVRSVVVNEEPWFVGRDVALNLGYTDTYGALKKHVDDEDKQNCQNDSFETNRGMIVINESGLYALIIGSKLPSARKFQRWVTGEILPSIRKHGMYATPDTVEAMLNDPDTMIKTLLHLKEERMRRSIAEEKYEVAVPKIQYANAVEEAVDAISLGQMATILKQNGYDTGQNRLCRQLRDEGYLVKTGDRKNLPTQRSMHLKIMRVKVSTKEDHLGIPRSYASAQVTGKGQIYFVNKYCGRLLPIQ